MENGENAHSTELKSLSTILLLVTKPFVKKFVDVKSTNTNAFSIIGKKALVIKEINSHSVGQIKINGEVWSAEAENEEVIPEGKRKCSGCGEIIDDADVFCANCGTKKED